MVEKLASLKLYKTFLKIIKKFPTHLKTKSKENLRTLYLFSNYQNYDQIERNYNDAVKMIPFFEKLANLEGDDRKIIDRVVFTNNKGEFENLFEK